jgi:hypothetical protein
MYYFRKVCTQVVVKEFTAYLYGTGTSDDLYDIKNTTLAYMLL